MKGEKNHMIISVDAEKVFDNIQHPFMIKTFNKLETEGNFLKIIKVTYEKPTGNNILNSERLKDFLLISGKIRMPLSTQYWKFQLGQLGKKKK